MEENNNKPTSNPPVRVKDKTNEQKSNSSSNLTLESVASQLKTSQDEYETQTDLLSSMDSSIVTLSKSIKSFTKLLEMKLLKLLENGVESRNNKSDDKPEKNIKKTSKKESSFLSKLLVVGLSLLLSPITVLSGLLVGFSEGFKDSMAKNLDNIKKSLSLISPAIKNILNKIIEPFSKMAKKIGESRLSKPFLFIIGGIINVAKSLGSIVGKGVDSIKNSITRLFEGIGKGIKPLRESAALKGVVNFFSSVMDGIRTLITIGTDGIVDTTKLKGMVKAIKSWLDKIKGIVKMVVNNPITKTLFNVAKSLGSIVGKVLGWPLSILVGLFGGLKKAFNTQGTFKDKLIAFASGFFKSIYNWIIREPLDMLLNGIKWLGGWLAGIFGFDSIAEKIKNTEFNPLDVVEDWLIKTWEWIKTLFSNPTEALSQLSDGIGNLKEFIWENIKSFAKWGLEKIGLGSVSDRIIGGADKAKLMVEDANGKILDFTKDKTIKAFDFIKSKFNQLTSPDDKDKIESLKRNGDIGESEKQTLMNLGVNRAVKTSKLSTKLENKLRSAEIPNQSAPSIITTTDNSIRHSSNQNIALDLSTTNSDSMLKLINDN